jgi:hypothetical protein
VKIHLAFEMDCAGTELARRHHDASTARSSARCDCFLESMSTINLAVAGRSEFCDIEVSIRKSWWLDPRQYLRNHAPHID